MIGDNIKKIRELKKLGVNELARRSNISGSYLSNIEKGVKTNPSIDALEKIAEALEVSVDEFFKSEPLSEEKLKEVTDGLKEEVIFSETSEFDTAEAAIQFILKQPALAAYGGYDIHEMSDEEIIEFANELLNQLKLLGYKYKK